MLKIIIPKVIGYYDENGYSYCINHAMDKSDSIFKEESINLDKCSVCGRYIDDSARPD